MTHLFLQSGKAPITIDKSTTFAVLTLSGIYEITAKFRTKYPEADRAIKKAMDSLALSILDLVNKESIADCELIKQQELQKAHSDYVIIQIYAMAEMARQLRIQKNKFDVNIKVKSMTWEGIMCDIHNLIAFWTGERYSRLDYISPTPNHGLKSNFSEDIQCIGANPEDFEDLILELDNMHIENQCYFFMHTCLYHYLNAIRSQITTPKIVVKSRNYSLVACYE